MMFRSKSLLALIVAVAPGFGDSQDLRGGHLGHIHSHVQRNAVESLVDFLSSDIPSDVPSFAPAVGEKENRAPISFFDKPSQSDVPSDVPSDSPSSAPSVFDKPEDGKDDKPGPDSVFADRDEVKEDAVEEVEQSDESWCSVNDFLTFVPPSDNLTLFTYTLAKADAAVDSPTYIVFNVSSYCEYLIYDFTGNKPYEYDVPNLWLNAVVLYFGGIPRVSNGSTLNGLAAPKASEISVVSLGTVFFEVTVSAAGDAVDGDEPLTFGFPKKAQAARFKNFLLSILDSAPGIFLKNQVVSCGSGPICVKMDKDKCFYNPRREKLGLMDEDGVVTYYDNSLEWFDHCAESLGCKHVFGNEQLLYFGVPSVSVKGTTFQFGREDGVDPVEWECYNVQAAHALVKFIEVAAKDPFNPLGVGGDFQNSDELLD